MKHAKMTVEEYQGLCGEDAGVCVACGTQTFGVEPDAHHYECDSCGKRSVFGLEEALMMGYIDILGDE